MHSDTKRCRVNIFLLNGKAGARNAFYIKRNNILCELDMSWALFWRKIITPDAHSTAQPMPPDAKMPTEASRARPMVNAGTTEAGRASSAVGMVAVT